MIRRLQELQTRHRRLDRLIDAYRTAGNHQEMQKLKRIRLMLKDKIANMMRRSNPSTC